jgi:hypothetical protein
MSGHRIHHPVTEHSLARSIKARTPLGCAVRLAGSLIGGIAETQEMLNFCGDCEANTCGRKKGTLRCLF